MMESLISNVFNGLEPFTTSQDLWVRLETAHGKITNEEPITHVGELHDLQLNEGKKMQHLLNRFDDIINRLT